MLVNTRGKLKAKTGGVSVATGTATPPPRTFPTTPLVVFQKSLDRARNIIKIHRMAHGKASHPPAFLSDSHRAVIVLAVSALDAYIRTLVVNKVITQLRNVSQGLQPQLRSHLKQLLSQDDLLDSARVGDLHTRVEKALKEKMEEMSYQGVSKITEAMKLVGHDDIFKEVARNCSKNEQELKESVGRFTKRRHIIAHCGDYDLSQTPPIENTIRKQDAEECIKLMHQIAVAIDKVAVK